MQRNERRIITNQTTVLERLETDHDKQRDLLDRIAKTTGESEERRELFTELTKELKIHAAAEEQAVYSERLADPEVRDETRHSVAEHHEIDEMLNDLAATDMSSPGWLQKFKQLDDRKKVEKSAAEVTPATAEDSKE